MDSRMFLLEFHVGTINFDSSFEPVPEKGDILFNIKFADVSINIDPEDLPFTKMDDKSRNVAYNMGKSYLFTTTPKDLMNDLKKDLEISLRVNHKTVGSTVITWSNDFTEMIKLYEKIGIVKAVDYGDVENLKDRSGRVMGNANIFVRLSCLGHTVEAQYRSQVVNNKTEYIFKNPYDKHTFKCEIANGEILPVVNLLNPATKVDTVQCDITKSVSWTEIFGVGEVTSRASYSPFAGTELRQSGVIPLTEILQRTSIETVSIVFRPDENKFFDLLNVFNTEVSTTRDTTKLTFFKERGKPGSRDHVESDEKAPEIDDTLELTADKINRKLCKNKDCPAAKKFKEYGIGPLATGKGLGTLYGDVEPPVEYGLSHTYGTMSNYGPFGVYSRPKRLDEPFIPPKNALETTLPPEPNKKCCSCCGRLRGGGPWPYQLFVLIENSFDDKRNLESSSNEAFRLRGGGPLPEQEIQCSKGKQTWRDILRLKGGGPLDADNSGQLKSPIKECKAVMDKFDEILTAYRKTLGPCGQATCPNAPSLAQEKCRSICGKGESIPPAKDGGALCETPCDFNGGFAAAACRDPKCAYAKYKLDLVDDDAALELQFLPPAVAGKCGHPKCPYPLQPDLPPIHWDCPDPLPKGNCRNPNCPHQPLDLKKLKCPVPKPGPCGSPDCPYALPPPCDLPTCPFRPKPTCPFLDKEQKKSCCQAEQEEESTDYVCENPECPFANEKINPSASFDMQGQFIGCSNPQCPFATKGKPRRPKAKSDKIDVCGNPSCPYAKVKKMSVCGNPSCPYAPKPEKQNFACGDPQCPFAEKLEETSKPIKNVCSNPQCPFAEKSNGTNKPMQNICSNPQCPFAEKNNKPMKNICSNPQCPFAEKSNGTNKPMKNICSNPQCPFAEKSNAASKPKQNDCGDPNCPFAGRPSDPPDKSEICDNPDCPFNEEKCSKTSADCDDSPSVCENPNCPYAKTEKPPICDDPMCPYMQPLPSCGIPGCPYEPVPMMPCPGPRKQSGVQKFSPPPIQHAEAFVFLETEITEVTIENGDDKRCSGDNSKNVEEAQKEQNGKKKKKKRSKFVYTMCNKYPGVKVGHKECVTPMFKVPPKMGWLWNIPTQILSLKPRRGWKPGAIQRSIAARIRAHREAKGLGILRLPKFRKHKDGGGYDDDDDVNVTPKPTLQIQKKDGAYWITMNPLKDPKTLVDNENPYMECTPMQFKITKNKKKKEEGDDESRLCYCEEEVDTSSSSDSELDIEFTPPAGIIHPERFKKKKNIVHCEAQYDPKDFATEKPEGKDKKGGKGDKKGKGGKKGKK